MEYSITASDIAKRIGCDRQDIYSSASYVLRSNELIQEGKTKEAAELFGKGLGYYSSNIIHAITPYATADAGLISTVLRYLASEIEEKNPGAKEMREWAETHVEKPELKEIKRIKKPNCK